MAKRDRPNWGCSAVSDDTLNCSSGNFTNYVNQHLDDEYSCGVAVINDGEGDGEKVRVSPESEELWRLWLIGGLKKV